MAEKQLTAQVIVPNSKVDPNNVKFDEIPLPPREMWEDHDYAANNAGKSERLTASAASAAPAPLPVSNRPRKALRFVSGQYQMTVPLKFPFEDDGLGLVDAITIRRLTVGEVGEVLDERTGDEPDNFDIYAKMTGLPADVLRGLMDVDGEEVSRVCFDFLPLIFRGAPVEPLSPPENGGA